MKTTKANSDAGGHFLRPKLRTGLNPEKSALPSMTQPEQLQPLERILSHRNQGIPVPYFNGVFSDEDTPDLQKMDFIDIAQLRETTTQGIEQANEDLHAINVQMEKLRQEAYNQAQKEQEEKEKPPVSPSA